MPVTPHVQYKAGRTMDGWISYIYLHIYIHISLIKWFSLLLASTHVSLLHSPSMILNFLPHFQPWDGNINALQVEDCSDLQTYKSHKIPHIYRSDYSYADWINRILMASQSNTGAIRRIDTDCRLLPSSQECVFTLGVVAWGNKGRALTSRWMHLYHGKGQFIRL